MSYGFYTEMVILFPLDLLFSIYERRSTVFPVEIPSSDVITSPGDDPLFP